MCTSYSSDKYKALYPQPELDSDITKGRFTGKVVIVTGGNSGIGKATVERFSNDGAAVAIFARDSDRGESTARQLRQLGRNVRFYQVDVTDRERCDEAVQLVADDNGGRIHYLINNAAITIKESHVNIAEAPLDTFSPLISSNVVSVTNMTQACFPYMEKDGPSCAIVNVSSVVGYQAIRNCALYGASKACVTMLTKCMALDLSSAGIRVNAVCPGYTWTPLANRFHGSRAGAGVHAKKTHLSGQLIEAAGVASVIAFLCSQDAMFIDGADVPVDSGHLAMGPEGTGQ